LKFTKAKWILTILFTPILVAWLMGNLGYELYNYPKGTYRILMHVVPIAIGWGLIIKFPFAAKEKSLTTEEEKGLITRFLLLILVPILVFLTLFVTACSNGDCL